MLGSNYIAFHKTIRDVFSSCARTPSKGVVPIENSLQGPINETIDCLAEDKNVFIQSEGILRVNFVLAKGPDTRTISKIVSNPAALFQVSGLISALGVNVDEVSSTSLAAEIATREKGVAAVCSEAAARYYGLTIVRNHVEDAPSYTRFLVISQGRSELKGVKTTLLIGLKHTPGSLFHALEPFSVHGVNLLMVYSRPLRGSKWEYYFYLDFDGNISEQNVRKALKDLEKVAEWVLVKGSYPVLGVINPD
jgi:prephenate dehydratase